MYCLPLSLPKLEKVDNQKIIDCYINNIDSAKHPEESISSNYRNLSYFEDRVHFFNQLFNGQLDQEFLEHMTIQRITGNSFSPHVDVFRKVTAMYTVRGLADTTFYDLDKSTFKEVKNIRMSLYEWYLFNNGKYHGVKNIQGGDRISLIIDFTSIFKNFDQAVQILDAKGLLCKNTNS